LVAAPSVAAGTPSPPAAGSLLPFGGASECDAEADAATPPSEARASAEASTRTRAVLLAPEAQAIERAHSADGAKRRPATILPPSYRRRARSATGRGRTGVV